MRYIYCHPLFDERKCAHRFSYQLSCAFKKNNLKLERFDYQGTGEAAGKFCDITTDTLRADLKKIINNDHACIIAARLAAAIAFDFCSQNKSNIQTLILIEPIINGQTYTEYLRRKQHLKDIMTGNSSEFSQEKNFQNLEGYKTSNAFIEQIKQIQLIKTAEKIKASVKIHFVQISTSSRINAEYKLLTKHLKKNGIQARTETFNLPPFWERIPDTNYSPLTEKIAEWCL